MEKLPNNTDAQVEKSGDWRESAEKAPEQAEQLLNEFGFSLEDPASAEKVAAMREAIGQLAAIIEEQHQTMVEA